MNSLNKSPLLLAFILILTSGCASQTLNSTREETSVPPTPPLPSTRITSELKQRVPAQGDRILGTIAQEAISSTMGIPKFYHLQNYQPIWTQDQGPLPIARSLVNFISETEAEGFKPESFHLTTISLLLKDFDQREYLRMPPDPLRLAELELLLTDAYLTISQQFQAGVVRSLHPKNDIKDPANFLFDAAQSHQLIETLRDALPQTVEYQRLRKALAEYRKLTKKEWTLIPPGKLISPGKRDRRIPLLRKRLLTTHDLSTQKSGYLTDTDLLDKKLTSALKRFQARHGITPTGILGPTTIKALNTSPHKRLRQILLNMERYRWISHTFGKRYIAVNIADFTLRGVDQNQTVLKMPVIVGDLYKQTPVFSSAMNEIVLNPYWYVPKSIIIESLVDKIKNDPSYLANEDFTVLKRIEKKGWQEVAPQEIDWDTLDENNLDLKLRQDPGPNNPLGQIKFLFPNAFSIYLHDTNQKNLFKKGIRTLSHGCIRVAKAVDLFNFVMSNPEQGDNTTWDEDRLNEALNENQEIHIPLKKPLAVHILYETAWVDDQGLIQFRDDIYGRDEALEPFIEQALH